MLTRLATSIGFEKTEVEAFLVSDQALEAVQKDFEVAKGLGISGVPFFVLNQKYGVSGAQPIEAFVEALTQAFNEKKEIINISTAGNSCGIDGIEPC